MSGEKRAAAESFGSTQLVKRQRSEAEMNDGALTNANGGALIQGVCSHSGSVMELAHGKAAKEKTNG